MAIKKYLDNITSQHRDKPKYMAWLSSILTILDHAYLVIKSIDINFDIDYAIGKQLDILGKIIGRKRVLTFQPLNGHDPVLDDETYRLVLKAKIAMNMWDGTVPKMYEIWDNIFKDIGLELQDNQDMSFNAYITGYVNQIRQDLIQHGYIVPKPEGVKVNYILKSPMEFKPYFATLVTTSKHEIINMSYEPKEIINFKKYSYFTMCNSSKSIISMKGVEDFGNI
ncbi:DUF2612 domain-containing protein [Clostridium botulinum]|uniref:DUF2612 domain-containing protein n=1 Tax=Clostridium botulinum TaxID=1491 RepID=UPI001C9B4C3D|nr:DUF2612 domain-containing protein [Clostridium botulinum]MBY6798096.1 DUF2612 domain-containing protein [Clostridium botulinum]MBY6867851.1 DUF2612 domain-containing protein [Clostridium botulinum]